MTKLYVQEFAGLTATTDGDSIPVPAEPPLASYVVDYTGGVASGPAYQATTKYLLVSADSICSVRFDGAAATVTDRRLGPSLAPMIVGAGSVASGHVSVITNT